MLKIDRKHPWPPEMDFSTVRGTLSGLERDLRRMPECHAIADALAETLRAIDRTEARYPKRLSGGILTASRFMPGPRRH